ncbi:hypothetical protein A6R68_23075 [Neotoma lepida]|uniref:Ubiquitin-like domain-containing protein n=1 Tax=Neotoma lepida TaxID=56216 RepID=A0A1A6HY69_NEOLE|nr:hypothetical protein A6R68_23075 [Neotoma lepida]
MYPDINYRSEISPEWISADQVERIKERVEEKEGIPPQQQRLIYSGKQIIKGNSSILLMRMVET